MKATGTTETKNTTIKVTLNREVQDEISYADGYNIKTGEKVHEMVEVKLTVKANGTTRTTTGKVNDMPFLNIYTAEQRQARNIPSQAYARFGDSAISEEIYNAIIALINKLDAEIGTVDGQKEIETAEKIAVEKQAIENAAIEAEITARNNHSGWCNKCESYCYGDCKS